MIAGDIGDFAWNWVNPVLMSVRVYLSILELDIMQDQIKLWTSKACCRMHCSFWIAKFWGIHHSRALALMDWVREWSCVDGAYSVCTLVLSNAALCQQPEEGFAWIIGFRESTFLIDFRFSGTYDNGTTGFTCSEECMDLIRHFIQFLLVLKVRKNAY